jgi:hypothetical protein
MGIYPEKTNRSKSVYNSPFIGQNLKGKVLLTCNNNQIFKSKIMIDPKIEISHYRCFAGFFKIWQL